MNPYKFGWFPDGETEQEYEYPNAWTRERTTGPDRLILAPGKDQVDLLLHCAAAMTGPYWLLYVLVVPRSTPEAGRFEGERELSYEGVRDFLSDFRDYLEQDGRHHLWIFSTGDHGLLVYDNHNVIYAYGPLDEIRQVAITQGLAAADQVRFPLPHYHRYNSAFDDEERRLLHSRVWVHKPLQDTDS